MQLLLLLAMLLELSSHLRVSAALDAAAVEAVAAVALADDVAGVGVVSVDTQIAFPRRLVCNQV